MNKRKAKPPDSRAKVEENLLKIVHFAQVLSSRLAKDKDTFEVARQIEILANESKRYLRNL